MSQWDAVEVMSQWDAVEVMSQWDAVEDLCLLDCSLYQNRPLQVATADDEFACR